MTRLEFWILNGFSLLLAMLITFELISSDSLDHAQSLAREAELPLIQAQQIQPLARQIVERTAQGAARDSALRDLLAKYGVQVTQATPPRVDPGSAPLQIGLNPPMNPPSHDTP